MPCRAILYRERKQKTTSNKIKSRHYRLTTSGQYRFVLCRIQWKSAKQAISRLNSLNPGRQGMKTAYAVDPCYRACFSSILM